ncbi:FAD-dependent oxidoreductase [Chloroflexota bacterium]
MENEVESDVLILGGGIAGCWAAISAAKKGLKVDIIEKGATVRSGAGGSGCDHWLYTANPCSKITPEEMVDAEFASTDGYTNTISRYIASREGYDTLLELEAMGGKIRDTVGKFIGAEFRDEKTKFCFAYDYVNKLHFRVWGTTFKPALYNECKRLGANIHDRTQATSLLTEGGKQGARVVGATGINIRTGEFTVFTAKATVLCMSRPQRVWEMSTELVGMSSLRPQTVIGNGHAMAWRAGAELTQMEKSAPGSEGIGYSFPHFGFGNANNTWYACNMVDANGKEIPFVDRDGRILETLAERYRPAPKQKFMGERSTAYQYRRPRLVPDLQERVKNGKYVLPLYADLPSMPEMEQKIIWGMMVGEEGKTKIPILRTYTRAGFDPNKDLLQSYMGLSEALSRGQGQVRSPGGTSNLRRFGEGGDAGGLVVDQNLKTSLEGLYAAGDQIYAANYHHHAAATGRYAGRKAAECAEKAAKPVITRKQVEAEKVRIYAPVKRKNGIEWKELNAASARIMQNYCGDLHTDDLLNLGLVWLEDLEENEASICYAPDPHKLGRTIDVLDLITNSEIIIHACLARKASSRSLSFYRIDHPEIDPPEWRKWITVKQQDNKVVVGEMPIHSVDDLAKNYEANNRNYKSWYDIEGI